MPNHMVFGVFTNREPAAAAIAALTRAGFNSNGISVLVPTSEAAAGKSDDTLGLLSGLVEVSIPGLRPAMGAGPMIASLAGWSTAGVAHGLVALRIPEPLAREYERQIGLGSLLVSVQTQDPQALTHLREIFLQHDAQSVGSSIEQPDERAVVNPRPSRPPPVILL